MCSIDFKKPELHSDMARYLLLSTFFFNYFALQSNANLQKYLLIRCVRALPVYGKVTLSLRNFTLEKMQAQLTALITFSLIVVFIHEIAVFVQLSHRKLGKMLFFSQLDALDVRIWYAVRLYQTFNILGLFDNIPLTQSFNYYIN